jgi:hypothetical protein
MRLYCVILSGCLSLLLVGCADVVKSNHATLADAKQDIERGWIPPILPASAVQIREWHDLDTNIGHGSFMFGHEGAEDFRSVLIPLPPSEPTRRVRLPREKMEREGYSFYSYGDFYIAVDWNRRRGEFWLAYSR